VRRVRVLRVGRRVVGVDVGVLGVGIGFGWGARRGEDSVGVGGCEAMVGFANGDDGDVVDDVGYDDSKKFKSSS